MQEDKWAAFCDDPSVMDDQERLERERNERPPSPVEDWDMRGRQRFISFMEYREEMEHNAAVEI